MLTARAVPTPLTLVMVATGWVASSLSDPRQVERISCPMPSADRPSDPLPRRIANSSLELKACAPWLRSRSRGLSAAGSSLIVSDNSTSIPFGFEMSHGASAGPAPLAGNRNRGAAYSPVNCYGLRTKLRTAD